MTSVVLLSGGLDSATVLAVAGKNGGDVYAMTFKYGQRHVHELKAAEQLAVRAGVKDHALIDIDLRRFGGSALTGAFEVPKHRTMDEIGKGVPATYVPARNTIFLSFALAWAEVLGAGVIYIGAHDLDYSGYPDCRPEYFRAFQGMADLATAAGIAGKGPKIVTPLLGMKKVDIIRLGLSLGVDYGITSSCYSPNYRGWPCGVCDSCILRVAAFIDAGIIDPLRYDGEDILIGG